MSFATRHNMVNPFTNIPSYGEHPTFFTLKELLEKNGPDCIYRFHGFYINKKGKFGPAPAAYIDGGIANFPSYMCEEMQSYGPEDFEDINSNRVGFRIRKFTDKNYGKVCYGVDWVDM